MCSDRRARGGGKFLLIRRDSDDVEHHGEYIELDLGRDGWSSCSKSPNTLPKNTRVSIDIVASLGGPDLTLTHEAVLPEWLECTRQGWRMVLGGLAGSLRQVSDDDATLVEPGTLRFERVLPGPIERVTP